MTDSRTFSTARRANLARRLRAAALAAAAPLLLAFSAAQAAGPSGFAPEAASTVAEALAAPNEAHVRLRGRFVKHVRGDKYEFRDEAGGAIVAELDDDRDWSMVAKDALMDVSAQIDRYRGKVEIDVLEAKPVR